MFVSCLEVGKAYENKFQYKMVWDKLLYYARFNRIDKKHTNFVSLSLVFTTDYYSIFYR